MRGAKLTRTYTMAIPRDARSGRQTLRLVGQDADQGADAFTTIILGDDEDENEGGDPGPSSLDELADAVRATERFDGVSLRIGRVRGEAFRDDDYRISGQAETTRPRVASLRLPRGERRETSRRGRAAVSRTPRSGRRRPAGPASSRGDGSAARRTAANAVGGGGHVLDERARPASPRP